jgi:hypothetical protein
MARPGRRSKSPGPVRLRRSASYPYHDVIDQLGAEVVAAARDERPPRRDHARLERRRWTATRTLDHRLGVNKFFTDIPATPASIPARNCCNGAPESACQRAGPSRS